MMKQSAGVVAVIAVMSFVLIGGFFGAAESKDGSLYDRLGGKDAITAVVDTSVASVGATTASTVILPVRILEN